MYSLDRYSSPPSSTVHWSGILVGSLGEKLTRGSGPDVALNGSNSDAGRSLPLPYTGFAAGAMNGCASVLNTTARLLRTALPRQDGTLLTVVQADAVRVVEGEEAVARDDVSNSSSTVPYVGHETGDSQVLEHLREPETLHVVDEVRVRRVNVVYRRERDRRRLEERREAVRRGHRALEKLHVARRAIRVEVRLEYFRAHEVVAVTGQDVEPVAVVEREVARARVPRAREVAVAGDVPERLGADSGAGELAGSGWSSCKKVALDLRSAGVGVPAAFVEGKADVHDGVVVQQLTAHDPVASHETCQVGTNMADSGAIVEVGKVSVVAHGRCL